MGVIRPETQLFSQLKATQLHRLAVSLGSACSGSKRTVIDGISRALDVPRGNGPRNAGHRRSPPISDFSIVSIDMGIKNLAYSHLMTPGHRPLVTESSGVGSDVAKVSESTCSTIGKNSLCSLRAWERFSISSGADRQQGRATDSTDGSPGDSNLPHTTSSYATAAYKFIDSILRNHDPTHILIEQQRFRSGGSSAVTEWTLRVGVFEGMLHAVIRTLREEKMKQTGKTHGELRLREVVSIDPARSTRFWLEGRKGTDGSAPLATREVKMTGRDGKQAKIDLVAQSLLDPENRGLVEIGSGQVKGMQTAFLNRWRASSSSKLQKEYRLQQKKEQKQKQKQVPVEDVQSTPWHDTSPTPIPAKLDDLADCLLQALAWLEWERMRELVRQDLTHRDGDVDPVAAVLQRLELQASLQPSRC